MNRPHLWALMAIPTLATAATAQAAPKSRAAVYSYTAETVVSARQQGAVAAGGLTWNCAGNRCTISGPWTAPGVGACKALAGAVGAIRLYGRDDGAHLDAAQLADCNASSRPPAAAVAPSAPAGTPPAAPAAAPGTGPTPAVGGAEHGRILRNIPGVRFTPPPPTDSATASKIALLAGFGATLSPAAFGASFWLTPQRPYIDADTYLTISYSPLPPSVEATAEMPYGSIGMNGSPRSGAYWIGLNFIGDRTRYYLAQCIVAGVPEYGFLALATRWSPPRGGRVNFVIEPALDRHRKALLWGVGAERTIWSFGGCEVTPFSP